MIRALSDGQRVMSSFPDHLHALLYPRAYPHPVRTVELIETHISWVLLTGKLAYKLKRPVHYDFIDLRNAGQRRLLCHEEVRLNRRFAPQLYLGVRAIRQRHGETRIGGSGAIVEHAVRMVQFSRSQELNALLETQRIAPAELRNFGGELAAMHQRLPAPRAGQRWGRAAAQLAGIRRNAVECARAAEALGAAAARTVQTVRSRLEAWADAALPLLERRFADGRVRECHGDLHAGNIVRHGAQLLPFDCLEFDPALRWIDVADEVAFLVADLEARQHPLHAQAFLSGYLSASGDYQACLLLPVFGAHRALVRAKILALSAATNHRTASVAREARRAHARYVARAQRALAPQQPKLVLMSGLSGSGKTWLAERLAPALAAVHVRSDIERKRLAGLSPVARSSSAVAQGLYAPAATEAVYRRLAQCAADALAGGYNTIIDATFGVARERERFRALATQLSLDTWIVYCHAPHGLLEKRLRERQRRGRDPSEADIAVLRWQESHFIPPAAREATAVLDAAEFSVPQLLRRLRAMT
jgi:aminoglycoside phosphotransferase family enzyme/predicted kinase